MKMERAFSVAITRVRRARDLTFESTVTMDFLNRINNAKWRRAFDEEALRVEEMSARTIELVRQHISDVGWLHLVARLDARANDGR